MYLNCHTSLSFRYGTLTAEELLGEAQRCGVSKFVVTEINNTSSYVELMRIIRQMRREMLGAGAESGSVVCPDIAVGIEFRHDGQLLYVGIAKNNAGFEELNRFLSFHNREGRRLPVAAPPFENCVVVYPFRKIEPEKLREYEFVGVRLSDIGALAIDRAYPAHREKFVLLQPVTFKDKVQFNIHRLLRAIDKNTLLSKLPAHEQADPDEVMIPESQLEARLADFPDIVTNSRAILSACSLEVEFGKDKNKSNVTGSAEGDWELLVSESRAGFSRRYSSIDEKLRERFERELRIIRSKQFVAYYLIAYDLIRFANSKGYAYVGRGSGANSMVAYCLGITNVDPVELDLYFERFLNEERTTPPDFDIDFSWDNRDGIYEYLFAKYGVEHTCLLGTHVTFQERSLLRELGKVFGLPKDEIEALVEDPRAMEHRDHITELIFKYARLMKDMPSNFSIHAGGVLITERPIYAYCTTDLPAKGYPVSQLEMHAAEDLGIFKFDVLSQRGLGHIKESVAIVERNRRIKIDINCFHDFKEDERIKDLLRNSRTMGCFYVESPAMRMLLKKLRCEDYLTLVAASSIIRPGVASSGMMRAYIERFHMVRNGQQYESIHPLMDELMRETYGVMVYQEDVIKVAHHFAGLTLTEADVLRRGMSGKYRSRQEFRNVRQKFHTNCRDRGYPQHVIDRVWYEVESFGGYSFAKGHSASYAVESYQSLYLKAHFPLEFMVAVINNFGGFYKTEFYFHEARTNGGQIQAPCLNHSEYGTTIHGKSIYVGFVHVKNLEVTIGKAIAAERNRNGRFRSMHDVLQRIPMALEQARILIRIGAMRFTGKNKQELLWEAMLYFSQNKTRTPRGGLFDVEPATYPLPELQRESIEDAFDEIELLGFPLCNPFDLLASPDYGDTVASELLSKTGRNVNIVGYLVTVKATRTKTRQTMNFGTFLDHQGHVFDTVHFPDTAQRFPMRGRGFYGIKGRVVEEFGVPSIEVTAMEKLPMINKRAEEFMRENIYDTHHE